MELIGGCYEQVLFGFVVRPGEVIKGGGGGFESKKKKKLPRHTYPMRPARGAWVAGRASGKGNR